mmetsp:Transcript_140585/g.365878  ORF Transcript_140585/g.365878 Transcript_140585/m.365878 type:complete len:219 (+) Transcript_140585:31-687(+)
MSIRVRVPSFAGCPMRPAPCATLGGGIPAHGRWGDPCWRRALGTAHRRSLGADPAGLSGEYVGTSDETLAVVGDLQTLLLVERAVPEGVRKGPAREVLFELLEWVECDVCASTWRRLLAARDLAEHAENVDSRHPQRQHAAVEVLVLAPRLRQEELAPRKALDIGRHRRRGQDLDRAMQAEATVVDVDSRRLRVDDEVSADVASIQTPIVIRGQVASF